MPLLIENDGRQENKARLPTGQTYHLLGIVSIFRRFCLLSSRIKDRGSNIVDPVYSLQS